ncbi:MAG: tetratricopeptide repeat protein [Bacteroidales bacterium]|nr:tetratricopeptide repeat protein [Bacteroidales bacterium]MCF8351571.1 tetratricopeptide repeat protein [Bacteroidales bacterium]MCF8376645.1 tetratricopeptide repeat protein [Bacteroidales bacterium]MCF8400633.1 tetratricopeptide repeat protein [Bacteroidales bacterium]
MTRLLIINIFLLTTYLSYSQVEDPNNFSVISKPLSELTQATGYSLQDNGRWAGDPNTIPFSDSRTVRNPTPKHKLGQDNFIKYEIRKVLIEDKQYNVIIKLYKDGEYEFPVLEEDWKSYKSARFWVFPANNLTAVLPDTIAFGQLHSANLNVFTYGEIKNYNPYNINDQIVNRINNTLNATYVNTADLVIAIWPVREDGRELLRFKFIPTFNKQSITVYYLDPRNMQRLFDQTYYETTFYRFRDFIRDAEVQNLPTKTDPSEFITHYKWGVLKYQAGNFEGAIEDFNKALEYNPDIQDFMIFSYLANAKTKLRDFDGAIEDYDRALSIRPTQVVDYSNWVRNYFNRGVAKFYVNDIENACEDWHKSYELGFGLALEYLNKYCIR